MPHKDPEKRKEYDRQWHKENKDPEKRREYQRNYRKIKNPNIKRHDSYLDFETHHQLAMSSGIQSQREWYECHRMRLLPDGIYQNPNKAFGRK